MGAFSGLMKQLLHLDRIQRISTHQALQHPFITVSYLTATGTVDENRCTICFDDGPTTAPSDGIITFQWRRFSCLVFRCRSTVSLLWRRANCLLFRWRSTISLLWRRSSSQPFWWRNSFCFIWWRSSLLVFWWSLSQRLKWNLFIGHLIGFLHLIYNEYLGICCYNGQLPCPYDEGIPKDFTAVASASSCHNRKLLKRIHRFFSFFSCCWYTTMQNWLHIISNCTVCFEKIAFCII